ncbi:amidohydrolase family protein [Sporichthya brevicatena]|uniref:Amidohydrolase family protein n=1 Tax=Sporichthya brevicatena TaxID=171442 RepID=A0ABN1GW14_9ACTN
MTAAPETDAELPGYWAALGLPGIVDVHVHLMPDRLQQKVWEYFDAAGPLLGRPWPVQYREDMSARLGRLRAMGVQAFTGLLYPHKPDMAAGLNAWAAEFAAQTPGCLHTATFFPEESAADYVREAIEAGARVFKAHVQVGGYDPRDELLDRVWGLLAEAGVPVVAHVGGGPTATAFTGPAVFGEVLARHPQLPAIVAHLGMPEFEGFVELGRRHPAVRFDVTGVFTKFGDDLWPFPRAEARAVLTELGDRILFGSDYPTMPNTYAEQVAAVAELDLGDEWLRAVFRENALTLWPDLQL